MNEMKKATININQRDYDTFKKLTKINNSDASKEIRKFIQKYIQEHNQLIFKD